MKAKKVITTALAGVMALSLAAPAFATTIRVLPETTESEFQVELEGMIYTPTIRVQVTETGSVYVNPSESLVAGTLTKALDGTDNLDYSLDGYGFVSTPILIRSDTDKALKVSAKVTATVPKTSGVTLADTVGSTATDKLVKVGVAGSSDALGDSSALKTTTSNGTTTVGLTEDKLSAASGTGATKITAAEGGKSAANASAVEVASINAATQTKDAAGKITNVVPQYGVVVVTGDSAAKASWTENDIVNVSVALSFAIDSTT